MPSKPNSLSAFHKSQEKSATLGTRDDPAEERVTVEVKHRTCSRASHQGGEKLWDTKTSDRRSTWECQRPTNRECGKDCQFC